MLTTIVVYTNSNIQNFWRKFENVIVNSNKCTHCDITDLPEMKAFIVIFYILTALKGNIHNSNQIWYHEILAATMSLKWNHFLTRFIGWKIRAHEFPCLMKSLFLFPMFHCHAHITNQLYSKVVTSSVAVDGAKRVRNGPKNCPKIIVGKYGKLWYRWIEHYKRDKKTHTNYVQKCICPKLFGVKVGVISRVTIHQNFEVGKYGRLWYLSIKHQKRDKKRTETYA